MAQSIITRAFEAWNVNKILNKEPARADKMIFALIPGQDENAEIDRGEGMPEAGQIQHTADITQYGALNENAVVYSVVLDTTIGNWDYNWVGLVDSASDTVLMIVHIATQSKIKTENGQQGNSLIRNLSMQFDGAAAATQITVTPETWQIDFSARLHSMDESRRLVNVDYYGDAAFRDEGFKVSVTGNTASVAPGLGYVAGLRAILGEADMLAVTAKTGIWVDICWEGTVTGAWANRFTLRAADTLENYVDAAGIQHYVTRIASIDGTAVTDERKPFPLDALEKEVEDLDVYSKVESDGRFLHKIGDTATGPILAPYFASTPDAKPEGAGAYGEQLSLKAPFYQPNWQWDVNDGGVFVPVAKGTSTRKGKGWPTAVSFGYLMPGTDMHAHPVIHAIGDSGQECIWDFNTQTGRIASKAGMFAIKEEITPAGVPLPWPGSSPPPGFIFMLGQGFNTDAYPLLAQLYPGGVLPDMRGRTILGKPDDRWPLTLADGDVKSHGHGGEVGAADLGSKETTQAGAFQPRLRSYNSNTSLDGGWSERHTIQQDRDYGDRNLNMIEPIPNHSHWVDIGWHGHTLRIDMTGAAKNTVDNIAFNYIVRLA
ncbi:Tail fiber protein [Serratia entomophila]|uniref:phage tail protein n=1 Tax=Serratia entomophila TaxID=42906 RepID=UPI002179712D|nr:phage tail protein [Serratia entomophila]CAI1157713.1 Tail fiber protein [Serratia entomophila]CAI1174494.1 Tail fiber protein [Serratia entomophila]